MTMITPSYLGETIEYSSLHACRSTLEDPTVDRRMISGTLPELMQNQNPWIRDYFHGPRARAAEKDSHG